MFRAYQYIAYRMYTAYQAEEKHPMQRTTTYLSILCISISFFLLTAVYPLFTYLLRTIAMPAIGFTLLKATLLTACALILPINYFFTRAYNFQNNKFDQYYRLTSTVRIWMLIVLPFALFALGIIIRVVAYGGTVLGRHVAGSLS